VTNPFDDWVASLGRSVSTDARALLRRVYDEHGPISPDQARRLGHDHQLALAREAVALLARDVAVTTSVEPPRFEYRDDGGSVRLAFRGRYATTPIYALSAAIIVEAANFMQVEVMEDLHGVWPSCSDHGRGLHPALSSGRAVWVCRAGGHIVSDIGRLPPNLG
jgi:hypothetical protein